VKTTPGVSEDFHPGGVDKPLVLSLSKGSNSKALYSSSVVEKNFQKNFHPGGVESLPR